MSVDRSITMSLARLSLVVLAGMVIAPTTIKAQSDVSAEAWVAPERASHRPNPLASSPDVLKRGQQLYGRECAKCHGASGRGDGPEGRTLTPHPADFTSDKVQAQSDGALFWKMSEGRGVMPQATLDDQEKWAVINYLRTLGPNRSLATSAKP